MDRIANITERGAIRRRRSGIAWLVVSAILLSILLYLGMPHWMRLVLAVPLTLAAIGFLQAREKT